jgi:hypothetical protein
MRKKIIIAAGAVTFAAICVVAVLIVWHGSRVSGRPVASAQGQAPPGAAAAVRLLISAAGRTALTPELNSVLGHGRLFPPGTSFAPDPASWHQAGAYGNLTGMLRIPGRAPHLAEVGLVHRGSHWLVTFEAMK